MYCICCCFSFTSCVFAFVLICAWIYEHGVMKPLLNYSVCRVSSDVGSASPCKHLNFSPHSVLHWMSASSPALSRSLSLSLLIHLLPRLPTLPSHQPPTPHTHTHTSNQSKDLSRLALEKTLWRHLFILTIFRYTFFSTSFSPHSFEFLTSSLNKRCSHPHGEWKVGGRVSNEGEEKAGKAEGKRLSLHTRSRLSPKTSTLYG